MPEKSELKVKEYEMFKAFYCGICKSMAKRIGNLPRITLNYDSTFLALILASLSSDELKITRKRCMLHPAKKRLVVIDNQIIDYAADMNIILSYHNLKDDEVDNKNIASKAGAMLLYPYYKRLRKKYESKCTMIENKLKELMEMEKNGCTSLDAIADPFSKIMEEIFTFGPLCEDKKNDEILRWIGYNIGKWIYILDAYDDMEKDAKEKKFNPILAKYGDKAYSKEVKDRIHFILIYSLDQIAKSYDLINRKRVKGIVENIINIGMLKKTEKILGMRSCNGIESV